MRSSRKSYMRGDLVRNDTPFPVSDTDTDAGASPSPPLTPEALPSSERSTPSIDEQYLEEAREALADDTASALYAAGYREPGVQVDGELCFCGDKSDVDIENMIQCSNRQVCSYSKLPPT